MSKFKVGDRVSGADGVVIGEVVKASFFHEPSNEYWVGVRWDEDEPIDEPEYDLELVSRAEKSQKGEMKEWHLTDEEKAAMLRVIKVARAIQAELKTNMKVSIEMEAELDEALFDLDVKE